MAAFQKSDYNYYQKNILPLTNDRNILSSKRGEQLTHGQNSRGELGFWIEGILPNNFVRLNNFLVGYNSSN